MLNRIIVDWNANEIKSLEELKFEIDARAVHDPDLDGRIRFGLADEEIIARYMNN